MLEKLLAAAPSLPLARTRSAKHSSSSSSKPDAPSIASADDAQSEQDSVETKGMIAVESTVDESEVTTTGSASGRATSRSETGWISGKQVSIFLIVGVTISAIHMGSIEDESGLVEVFSHASMDGIIPSVSIDSGRRSTAIEEAPNGTNGIGREEHESRISSPRALKTAAENAPAQLRVAVHMIGFLNYFLDPKGRATVVKHLLLPLQKTTQLHAFLCTDTTLVKFLTEDEHLRDRVNITLFHNRFPGRRQFWRKAWCHEQLEEWSRNHSMSFDWLIQTRPDLVYFSDVPDIRTLTPDRVYGRMRAAGISYTSRWNLSSLHFSHAFSAPWEVGCWGRHFKWQEECVIIDDQFDIIPWKFAKALNVPGAEWGGFRGNALSLQKRHVKTIAHSNPTTSYSMCIAAFPGEGYFTRAMVTSEIPFQPLSLNACLGKNVWHERRRRWDCGFKAREEKEMLKWSKQFDCASSPNSKKTLWEEWESAVALCNTSHPLKYTGNAGC